MDHKGTTIGTTHAQKGPLKRHFFVVPRRLREEEVPNLMAKVAELVDALDSKSSPVHTR
jgi:hypothetical protein